MRRTRRRPLAAVTVLGLGWLLIVTSCSDSGGDTRASGTGSSTVGSASTDPSEPTADSGITGSDPESGTIDWGACDDPAVTDDRLQCATVVVPLDHDQPDGETIPLALVKMPASSDSREGAILFNPGGPGGSGFEYVAGGGPTISAELGLDRFDLIGFDPRGVDRSGGLRCLSDEELDTYAYPDDTPDTPEEEAFLDEADQAFAAACSATYGDSLRLYSTENTARDIDAIRASLGDDRISFLGISYGTYLGSVYATMFPDRVRAMVLDSAFEPGGDTIEQQYMTQLVGFEDAFDDWATWCEDTETCRFGNDDVGAAWDVLHDRLDAEPLTNSDGRIGNQALLDRATRAALYSKLEWPVLGAALESAADGDPAGLFRLADAYFSRDADGRYATIQQSNVIINCASGIESEPPPDPEALAEQLRAAAPRFGKSITADDLRDGDGCTDLMPAQPLAPISYDGDAPIVVVGGQNDPATPFRWAEEMSAALGRSARLVTYTGEGHGQLLASSCVTDIEAAVLTDLDLPDEGVVCEPDPEIVRPEWWSTVPVPDGVGPVTESPEIAAALGLTPTDLYSEIHTSTLEMTKVLAAYRPVLEAVGFRYLGEQAPLPGTTQAVYAAPNDDFFSVLVLGPDAFDDPLLESASGLLPDGEILVILLYLPEP